MCTCMCVVCACVRARVCVWAYVSACHPDKISDQISDALLDNFLAFDPESKVACETLVTTGQVILAGEVKSDTYLDLQAIARETVRYLHALLNCLFRQSDQKQKSVQSAARARA